MLTRIDLRYFKCFALLKLPLCKLTLLSGANASGKSSVIQALALLHQTMREHEWSTRLMLNGGAVRLGTVGDVIDQVHGRHSCEIALLDDERAYEWEFEGERDEMSMAVRRVSVDLDAPDIGDSEPLHYLLPSNRLPAPSHDSSLTGRLRGLTYLTAERLGTARVLHIGRSPTHACRRSTGGIRRQRPSLRPRHPRVEEPGGSGRAAYSVPAGRGPDGAVLSGLQIGDRASSPHQRRNAGDSYIQRYGLPSSNPYRIRTDPSSTDRGRGLVCK